MSSRFELTRSPNEFIPSIMASISAMSFSIYGVNLPCFYAWSLKPLIMPAGLFLAAASASFCFLVFGLNGAPSFQ